MHEVTTTPALTPETPEDLATAAQLAEAWFGEPFLHPGEEPEEALAPGTARRAALDHAHEEMAAGLTAPSYRWKVRYGLMLGLERVLSQLPVRLASGTELRRHQVDALAGLLTELIALHEQPAGLNGNGGELSVDELEELEAEEDEELRIDEAAAEDAEEDDAPPPDPGAVRRFRFRHPTASGKTIAAAGFVEAARTLGVLILTHRRLLVSQFTRDLTTEGYGERLAPAVERGQKPPTPNPITIFLTER
jgi:hypothetical protein